MSRYFIEVSYLGSKFSGFQLQQGLRPTIQGEVNRALSILCKCEIQTTTSSRTDAGVHAFQNFLHLDVDYKLTQKCIYSLNAILDNDIVLKQIYHVPPTAHSRFDAISRAYTYHIHHAKNPFVKEKSYYFPFKLDFDKLEQCAKILKSHIDFTSFSKKHTDVKTNICTILESSWNISKENTISFHVTSNRFLRGMVKALVGTQLLVGRGHISIAEFEEIIINKDCTLADFSPPSQGLFLEQVNYPIQLLSNSV